MSRTPAILGSVLCLMFGAQIGTSQGFFVTGNAGYSLGAGTQVLGANSTSLGTTGTTEGVYGSLGEGLKFGASAGYMLNENIGTELGISYFLGKAFEITLKTGSTSTTKLSGSGFMAIPSIVLSAKMKVVNPYARFGLVLGIMRVKQDIIVSQAGQSLEYSLEESGGLAFGYAGALGIVIPTGGSVDFLVEVDLHSVTYSPSQAEVTKFTLNGVDQLPTIADKVIKYEENVSTGSQNVSLAVRRPFSAIGIMLGARVNL